MAGADGVHQHDVALWRDSGPSLCVCEHDLSDRRLWPGAAEEICTCGSGDALWHHYLAGMDSVGALGCWC